jgi:hypothetical protein
MKNLEQILSVALSVPMDDPADPKCRWGLPLMLEGSPGIGKSGRVRGAATSVGLETSVVYPATRQPEDFSGAPIPDGKGGVAIECILPAVRQMVKLGRGVIFVDEITCARPAVQGALLGFIYERVCGDTVLPGQVRILAAGNPAGEAAGGWNLAPPMANRLAWLDVKKPDTREWAQWLLSGPARLASITDAEDLVKKGWARAWSKLQGLGAAFIQANPDIHYLLPEEGNPERHRAWPSPRTWEFALRAVATCHALGKSDLQFDFVKACVGEAAATEWAAWVTDRDLPDAEEMLTKGWTAHPSRIDVTIAALSSLAAFIKSYPAGPKRTAYAAKAWDILSATAQAGMADTIVIPSGILLTEGFTATGPTVDPVVKSAARPAVAKAHKLGLKALA